MDVLGFQEKLGEFEEEAKKHYSQTNILSSPKANQFIQVFKDVVELMQDVDCNYYLFSDNMCITVDAENNREMAVDLLFTVSELFYRFAQMGYFLRGGIDYGLMLDEEEIALGAPLAEAYKIENKVANFPRIVLSDSFDKLLKDLIAYGDLHEASLFNIHHFLKTSCEITYVNPFYNIVKIPDKVGFFKDYKKAIEEQIENSRTQENIFMKFKWLAEEHNAFLEDYLEQSNYLDQNYDLEDQEAEELQKLKIQNHVK